MRHFEKDYATGRFICPCGRTHVDRQTVLAHMGLKEVKKKNEKRTTITDRTSGESEESIEKSTVHAAGSDKIVGSKSGKGVNRITLNPDLEIHDVEAERKPVEKTILKPDPEEEKELDTCGKCGQELTGRPVACPGCGARLNWSAVYR